MALHSFFIQNTFQSFSKSFPKLTQRRTKRPKYFESPVSEQIWLAVGWHIWKQKIVQSDKRVSIKVGQRVRVYSHANVLKVAVDNYQSTQFVWSKVG